MPIATEGVGTRAPATSNCTIKSSPSSQAWLSSTQNFNVELVARFSKKPRTSTASISVTLSHETCCILFHKVPNDTHRASKNDPILRK